MTCFIYISESEKIICQKRRKVGQTAQWPKHRLCQREPEWRRGGSTSPQYQCSCGWEKPQQLKRQLAWCTGQQRKGSVSGKVEGVGGIPAGCGWAAKVGARPLKTAGFSCQTAI